MDVLLFLKFFEFAWLVSRDVQVQYFGAPLRGYAKYYFHGLWVMLSCLACPDSKNYY